MTNTREQLKQAYALIREDQPEPARLLLAPVLEQDPQNVHAWWLWAYAVDDPHEVRDALNKVLALDPNYANAPKAREMLQVLEEQYFSPAASSVGSDGVLSHEDAGVLDVDSFFSDADVLEEPDGALDTVGSGFFESEESLLAEFDEAMRGTGAEGLEATDFLSDADSDVDADALDSFLGETPEPLTDNDARAAADEHAAPGRVGPVRRLTRAVLFLALIGIVVAGAWFVFLRDNKSESDDPGALTAAVVDSPTVFGGIAAAEGLLVTEALGGEPKALVADSVLGKTLYVEFCREPGPDLAATIARAMQIAAEQSVVVAGEVTAVGVSINRCGAKPHDTLYRAVVPIEEAQLFVTGQAGTGDLAWTEFQNKWRTP